MSRTQIGLTFDTDYEVLLALEHLRQGCSVGCSLIRRLADQIEAQTKPPKPAEPTGLGAVVETDGGVRFVRLPDGIWTSEDESQPWDNVNAVKVLSKGVTS